jgi:hypothetical protein
MESKFKVTVALVVGVCSYAALSSAGAAEDEIYGSYKLVNSSRKLLDSGQVETFPKEQGYITYGRDGRMQVLIVRGNRPKAESVEKLTDQQRIELFRSLTAYSGTYKYDGKSVEHHIDISWNEVWTGTTQIRDVKKEGDRVILTTRPAPFAADGKMSVVTLEWEKLK